MTYEVVITGTAFRLAGAANVHEVIGALSRALDAREQISLADGGTLVVGAALAAAVRPVSE